MSKIISFCLWSNIQKYNIGAIKNAQLARDLYPDWECRFYCGYSVPESTIDSLLKIGKACESIGELIDYPNSDRWSLDDRDRSNLDTHVIRVPTSGDWRMMLDRFRPIGEADVEVMISRDCDSRLSLREKEAVDQWLQSDKSFHTMHCHFHHSVPILGGMFGIKKGLFSEMSRHAMEWAQSHEARWQCDQDFLTQVVWPVVKNDTLNHADFHTNFWPGIPFPSPIEPGHFIGATYDENDNIDQTQLKQLYG